MNRGVASDAFRFGHPCSDSGTSLRVAAYLRESDFDPGNFERNEPRARIIRYMYACTLVFRRFSAGKTFRRRARSR